MTHRPAAPTELPTDERSAGDGDDSIEFAEFTDDDAEPENPHDSVNGSAAIATAEASPPIWFKGRTAETSADTALEDASRQDASQAIVTSEPSESEKVTSRQRGRRKRGATDEQKNKAIDPLIATADEEPPLDWKKDWKNLALAWLISTASCGYGVSLIFHSVVLVAMSAVVYHSMEDNQSISTIITDADAMPIEFTEIMDLTVEPAGSSQNQLPQLTKIPITTAEAEISSSLLDSTASNAGNNGEGGDTDEGFGFMFSMPQGGKVVSRGSFSAWTVPEDPEPRKDYMIVIRIKLPETTKLYRISDLSGKVEGSDLCEQYLPFDPNRKDLAARSELGGQIIQLRSSSRLRVIKNHVQIMIPVKGGDNQIRDTIHIKSRMLNEDQKLEIVF